MCVSLLLMRTKFISRKSELRSILISFGLLILFFSSPKVFVYFISYLFKRCFFVKLFVLLLLLPKDWIKSFFFFFFCIKVMLILVYLYIFYCVLPEFYHSCEGEHIYAKIWPNHRRVCWAKITHPTKHALSRASLIQLGATSTYWCIYSPFFLSFLILLHIHHNIFVRLILYILFSFKCPTLNV